MPQLGKQNPVVKHMCKHSWINSIDVVETVQSQAIILSTTEHLLNCIHFLNCYG